MNKRIVIPIIISICLMAFSALMYFVLTNVEADFIQFHSYFSAEKSTSYTIDLPYFIKLNEKDVFCTQDIKSIRFKNSALTKIQNIKSSYGDKAKEYYIKTLSLTVLFTNTGTESINQLEIKLKNGRTFDFDIGNLKFDVLEPTGGDHLGLSDQFTLLESDLSNFILAVKNDANSDIEIENMIINMQEIKPQFEKLHVKAGESVNKAIPIKKLNEAAKRQEFWAIRPCIRYIYNGKTYNFFPPAIYYGLMDLTDQKIQTEISRSK